MRIRWADEASLGKQPLRLFDKVLACVLAGTVLLLGALRLTPTACGAYHDDAVYVATAKSIAEGTGYRLIDLPESPVQTKYPVLYPALLAVAWRVWPSFPDNLRLMETLSLAAGAASIALSYLLLVRFRYASRPVAFAGTCVCATSAFVLFLSTQTLSEMPFALLQVAALWALEVTVRRTATDARADFLSGAVVALPFLCRSLGIAVLVAAGVSLLMRRRPVLAFATGALAAALPWIAWSIQAAGAWKANPLSGYYTDYLGAWSVLAWQHLPRIVLTNALFVLVGPAQLALSGATETGWFSPELTGPLMLSIGVITGGVVWARVIHRTRAGEPVAVLQLATVSVALGWPWPPGRFLAPALPLLLALAAPNKLQIDRLRLRVPLRALAGLAVLVVVSANLAGSSRVADYVRRLGYPYSSTSEADASWSSYQDLFSWLRSNTEAHDVFASGLDTMVYLYTGHKSFRPFIHRPDALFYGAAGPKTGSVDEFFGILRAGHAAYLVVTPMPGFAEESSLDQLVSDSLAAAPGRLSLVYAGSDARFRIFKVGSY